MTKGGGQTFTVQATQDTHGRGQRALHRFAVRPAARDAGCRSDIRHDDDHRRRHAGTLDQQRVRRPKGDASALHDLALAAGGEQRHGDLRHRKRKRCRAGRLHGGVGDGPHVHAGPDDEDRRRSDDRRDASRSNENNETFTLNLSNASANVNVSDATGTAHDHRRRRGAVDQVDRGRHGHRGQHRHRRRRHDGRR